MRRRTVAFTWTRRSVAACACTRCKDLKGKEKRRGERKTLFASPPPLTAHARSTSPSHASLHITLGDLKALAGQPKYPGLISVSAGAPLHQSLLRE